MSKEKKEMRAAKRAQREEQQGKKVIAWIVGCLLVAFIILFIAYIA